MDHEQLQEQLQQALRAISNALKALREMGVASLDTAEGKAALQELDTTQGTVETSTAPAPARGAGARQEPRPPGSAR
jgi:hypothetical protein